MNGRLQRVWFVLRLGLALGLGWIFGWPWGIFAWCAQPLLLLPLFAVLRWVNRKQRPSWRQVLRAWWLEVLASERAFGWEQPWREWAVPDHLPAQAEQGVLLLHGYCCNRGRWNPWMRRLRAQGIAFMAPSLEPAFGSIDAYAEEIEQAVRRLQVLTGRPPLIAAHSMGGLAARAWWRRFGAAHDQAPRLITLGTPHLGTLMAAFSPTPNAVQMRRASRWIAELPSMPDVDCLWTPCDQIASPAHTAIQDGAREHLLDGVGHMSLVYDPRAWALFQAAIQAPAGASSLSTPRRI